MALTSPAVIVSITSLPSRIGGIRPCLESLLAGALVPDKILIPLPLRSLREDSTYTLPEFLSAPEFATSVEVVRVQQDWGPGTKLLGAIHGLTQPCYLVIADDDVAYKPSFLKGLISAQSADHAASFSYHVYPWRGLNIGQGCDGFSFWSPNLARIEPFFRKCVDGTNLRFHDDLWISFYLASRGIAVRRAEAPAGLIYEPLYETQGLASATGEMSRRRLSTEGLRQMIRLVDMSWGWKTRVRLGTLRDRLVGHPARKLRHKIARLSARRPSMPS